MLGDSAKHGSSFHVKSEQGFYLRCDVKKNKKNDDNDDDDDCPEKVRATQERYGRVHKFLYSHYILIKYELQIVIF